MKQPNSILKIKNVICLCVFFSSVQLYAQGYGQPLTMQGINHLSVTSTASRSAGGITTGIQNDISIMFSNPAMLQSLQSLQVTFGGLYQSWNAEQTQQWIPLRYLSNFSLLMEGLTDSLSDPIPDSDLSRALGPEDSIQRPYDSIKPNWARSKKYTFPLQAFLAVPFSVGGFSFVAGAGVVEYANLNYYFQNNNVLSPSIGSQRPYGIHLPGLNDTVYVKWSQYSQSREGSIWGYGSALSMAISNKFSIGFSGQILSGTSDDIETEVGRGRLRFGNNSQRYYFVNDSVDYQVVKTGTSEYSGMELAVSAILKGKYVSISGVLKAPSTITRKYKTTSNIDSISLSISQTLNEEDEIFLPWRGTIGLSLAVREDLTFGLEYEFKPYSSATYKDAQGIESKPWLSSSVLHAGFIFTPQSWLTLRGGYFEQSEVFEPTGNPLIGDPVTYAVYSLGCGFLFGGIRLNIGYEYSLMKYQDLWQTNINLNSEKHQNIFADISYIF